MVCSHWWSGEDFRHDDAFTVNCKLEDDVAASLGRLKWVRIAIIVVLLISRLQQGSFRQTTWCCNANHRYCPEYTKEKRGKQRMSWTNDLNICPQFVTSAIQPTNQESGYSFPAQHERVMSWLVEIMHPNKPATSASHSQIDRPPSLPRHKRHQRRCCGMTRPLVRASTPERR